MIPGGSLKFVHFGIVTVFALITTALATESLLKVLHITFRPLGKKVNATVVTLSLVGEVGVVLA